MLTTTSVPTYEPPRLVERSDVYETENHAGPAPVIVVFIVSASLIALLGAFAICIARGYDGVAFQASIDSWTFKLGCYKNP